jgi:general secretion pathway protein K
MEKELKTETPVSPVPSPLKNQKGVAILMALAFIMLMSYFAVEVAYDTRVEYQIASGDLDRLKAYYNSKAGLEFSLFRIHLYRTAMAQFGSQIPNPSMLDLIWQFPFSWPPLIPKEAGMNVESDIQKATKESILDGGFGTTIESEGAKIDINDLGSPALALRLSVRNQLEQMLRNRLDADDEWARANRNMDVNRILNFIQDWVSVDPSGASANGGPKSSYYKDLKDVNMDQIPPQAPFKTLDELHMVHEMTDEIFDLIAPRLTVYGSHGINVNYAPKDVLMAIDPQITKEVVEEIEKRRKDPAQGPFKNQQDFEGFLTSQRVNLQTFNRPLAQQSSLYGYNPAAQPAGTPGGGAGTAPSGNPFLTQRVPLIFDQEMNFRVKSIGYYGKTERTIIAIVYDFAKAASRLKQMIPTTTTTQPGTVPGMTPTTPHATTTTTVPTTPPPTGKPQVVYWQED